MLKNCLILKLRDFGENSLLVSVLHSQLGRQEFLAKGGKKIGAKLTPLLQPLNLVNLWLAPAKGEIATIREVEPLEQYLPSSYLPLTFTLRLISLLEKATYPYVECEEFMQRILKVLRIICQTPLPLDELKKLWLHSEVLILSFLGIKPETNKDQKQTIDTLAKALKKQIEHYLSP